MPEQTKSANVRTNNRYPRKESAFMRAVKPLWYKFKQSALFINFRHSRLNPFHISLLNINSGTLQEAREIAIGLKLRYFEYKGIRASTDEPYSITREAGKRQRIFRNGRNALDVIPRNADGIPDLTAEEPIIIAILPIEGPSLLGHAALQYKDLVVNRLFYKMDTKPLLPRYGTMADYYVIYPSQVGIDPEKLIRTIKKVNVLKGGEYDFVTNNCACAVDYVLQQCGIKDLDYIGPDKLGIYWSSPGNNPFRKGIQEWCRQRGVHVFTSELEDVYKYNTIENHQDIADNYKKIRERVLRDKAYKHSWKRIAQKVTKKLPFMRNNSKDRSC